MPGFVHHVGASTLCPHAGQGNTLPGNARVRVSGQPIATQADATVVAGCVFTLPSATPQPCVEVAWLVPAARVKASGQGVLLQSGPALCNAAGKIPQGSPIITGQTRVRAT